MVQELCKEICPANAQDYIQQTSKYNGGDCPGQPVAPSVWFPLCRPHKVCLPVWFMVHTNFCITGSTSPVRDRCHPSCSWHLMRLLSLQVFFLLACHCDYPFSYTGTTGSRLWVCREQASESLQTRQEDDHRLSIGQPCWPVGCLPGYRPHFNPPTH